MLSGNDESRPYCKLCVHVEDICLVGSRQQRVLDSGLWSRAPLVDVMFAIGGMSFQLKSMLLTHVRYDHIYRLAN